LVFSSKLNSKLNPTAEYIEALIRSDRLGGQVAAHHYIQPSKPETLQPSHHLPKTMVQMLERLGITHLYSHQIDAIDRIRQGRHTVVATPTASGKSLIYNLSFMLLHASDPHARGIYLFPLKALTQDQFKTFSQWSNALGSSDLRASVYDGDTNSYQRKKIKSNPPSVVMTNPEMLHLALLPHHHQWQTLFANLKLIVLDEVHTYRGFMGSHMCQVLRRLQRVCAHYGSSPTFVLLSATLANADKLATQLSGLDVDLITNSGAPIGGRHMVLIDPLEGPAKTSILLLKAALARGLKTIVYTQSRKLAELITLWVQQGNSRAASQTAVYRAGLLPEERRTIEDDLKTGKLLGVVTTSALELGIDIGDLDICILVGFPGSIIATLQRGGRVGRKGQVAALLFVAGQDALDQYYIRNPSAFFNGRAESAVVNPYNTKVLTQHLVCAAAELPLLKTESWPNQRDVQPVVDKLLDRGELITMADGNRIIARSKRPHYKVDLRAAGDRYRIVHGDKTLGEINGHRRYFETHPGAIYLHRGRFYRVTNLDESTASIYVQPSNTDHYTRVYNETEVSILEIIDDKIVGNTICYLGKLKVTEHVTGYERISTRNGRRLGRHDLEVPPITIETEGFWWVLDDDSCDMVQSNGHHLLGALHAAEHTTIGIMPLIVLADRNDLGGLATPGHPQTGNATIFIYDGIPGGAGWSRLGFNQAIQLLNKAQACIDACGCEDGCPACVQSPKCGSGNQPMDKTGGGLLLKEMARSNSLTNKSMIRMRSPVLDPPKHKGPNPKPMHYGVFDLETQRSAAEVGGWHMAHRMRVSCGVVYDSRDDTYSVYEESKIEDLIGHLKQLELVVGFNIKRFDYNVLRRYCDDNFDDLDSLDLLERVHRTLGFRLSLDHLATQTLNAQKSGTGLDALKWWKEGRLEKIADYCRKDVQLTRDLYIFARDKGYLIYTNRDGDRLRVPINLD
jgi:DEAD/DEAH box helicase domain-containing protein